MQTARALAAFSLLALMGCEDLPATVRGPAYRRVQFVGTVPPSPQYRMVGHVEGSAPEEDFVNAAHDARVDIKMKAARLGGYFVKIDDVKAPPAVRNGRRHVLLTGRAYRMVEADEASLDAGDRRTASSSRRPRGPI